MTLPAAAFSRERTPVQEKAGPDSGEGKSMAPPAFGLTTGNPIQMAANPPGIGGGNSTNYSFDTGQITARDLNDPQILQRLEAMSYGSLQSYRDQVRDPDVVNWIENRLAQIAPPAARQIRDNRIHVLPQQRAMYTRLVNYLVQKQVEINALLQNAPPQHAWLTNNANVNAVTARLGRLIGELQQDALIIRFDPALNNGSTAASYGFTNDRIRLRPITNNVSLAQVAASLMHEYMHAEQDRAMETLLQRNHQRQEHDRQDAITHEVEGRQSGVYMIQLLQALGEWQVGTHTSLGEQVSNQIFKSNFEAERTGTPAEAARARRDTRSTIATAYASQIATNSPSATYFAELNALNEIELTIPGGTQNLGAVPGNVTSPDQLSTHLIPVIENLPSSVRNRIFRGSGRTQYRHISVLVYFHGRKLSEFVVCRNGQANGQCVP